MILCTQNWKDGKRVEDKQSGEMESEGIPPWRESGGRARNVVVGPKQINTGIRNIDYAADDVFRINYYYRRQ